MCAAKTPRDSNIVEMQNYVILMFIKKPNVTAK